MVLAYFKDRFIPESECRISINDRAFRFGDGIFETILVYNGRLYDTQRHLERLQRGLDAYGFALEIQGLKAIAEELIVRNALLEGYIRIIVSRGENGPGAVGYLPKGCVPYLVVQSVAKAFPAFQALSLWQSSLPASVKTICKTNNALFYTLAMMEADSQDCQNALLCDSNGYICETASGNLFWFKNGILFYPSGELPYVPGTMQAKLLDCWEGEKRPGHYTLNDLAEADEVGMTNVATLVAAVIALQPAGLRWQPGNYTKMLRERVENDIRAACPAKTLEKP